MKRVRRFKRRIGILAGVTRDGGVEYGNRLFVLTDKVIAEITL